MDDLLLKRIESLSPENRKTLELYLKNKGIEDINILSTTRPPVTAINTISYPGRKRIKVSSANPLEENSWNSFLKYLRSGINSSPFTELLSPEIGVLFVELKKNAPAESEIAGIINKALAVVAVENPEIIIEDVDQEAYHRLDDISDTLKDCNYNLEWNHSRHELKVELIRDDTAYLNNLHLCYILANQNLLPWYYQHYIQIRSWPPYNSCNYTEFGFEHTSEIMEKMNVLGYRMLRHISNIIEFALENIDCGNYLLIYMDEYYLPQKASFKNTHFVHPSLVYGYDNEKRKIMAIGFDENMVIDKIELDYPDFLKAYEKGKLYHMNGADEEFVIYMFKPREFKTIYPFDLNRFLTELHNYLFSEYDAENEYFCKDVNTNVKFGLNAFDSFLKCLVQTESKEGIIEYRAIHFIWEHKKGIYNRLEYIIQKYHLIERLGDWLNKYRSVIELAQKARMLFIQSSTSNGWLYYIERDKDKETIEKISDILKQARDEESKILLTIYSIMKSECLPKPHFLAQKNISGRAVISTSINSGDYYGLDTISIELAWDTPRIIDRIHIVDNENNGGWRILGCLYFSDGSSINISDCNNHWGSIKEIKFDPKKVHFTKLNIPGKSDTFIKLPEIYVFEI